MIYNISDINLWELGTTALELQNKTWEQIKKANGDDTRIRTKNLFPCSSSLKVKISSNYKIDLLWFNEEGLMISEIETNWIQGNNNEFISISVPNDAKQVGILVRFTNDSTISPSEILNTNIYYDDGLLPNNSIIAENIINIIIGEIPALKMYFGNDLIWNSVPYDAEIEYLESSGTQWIDTLIHPTTGYGFELYGGFTAFNNNEFFGGGTKYDNGLGICTHGAGSYGIIVGTTEVCTVAATNNVMHLFLVNSDGTVYIDNEYKGQSTTSMPDGNYTMNIFRHSATKVTQAEKIYYCKIFNNEGLVFDGIPVRKDGIGYMFDRVSKTLFDNQGTGSFTLGPDKT